MINAIINCKGGCASPLWQQVQSAKAPSNGEQCNYHSGGVIGTAVNSRNSDPTG